jgi:hypothetical protein
MVAKIQISTDSDLPADTVLAAITDFSSRRPRLWPNIDPGIYRVHEVGADSADVTEGSKIAGGVWARERYDWSVPRGGACHGAGLNIFKSGFWEMGVSTGDGGSHIEILQDRRAKGIKGHLLGGMMTLMGRRVYRQGLDKTLAVLREEVARGSSPTA